MINILNLLKQGAQNIQTQALLKNSLFYYCSGKDVTPILAFKGDYPLYVYADLVNYGRGGFNELIGELLKRLKKASFYLLEEKKLLNGEFSFEYEQAHLSKWKDENNKEFYLLFIQGDAVNVFNGIYYCDMKETLPKCICNYRYEMNNRAQLQKAEKKVQFVLGHCFNENFAKIKEQ